MANILNAGDILLQATDPRLVRTELPDNLVVPAVKEIKLSASAGAFRVTNTGVSDLQEITFIASLIHIDETSTVYITIGTGGTLQPHSEPGFAADRTAKLLYSEMTATSVRVTATVTEYPGTDNEETYTTFIDVVKVQDGYDAEYLVVNGDQVFKHLPASVTPINTTITLTARLYGHLTLYQWQYYDKLTNPGSPAWVDITGANGATYNLTYNFLGWDTQNSLSIRCASFYSLNNTTYTDEITIVKLYDGVEGLTPVMPNSSHTIPSNSDGVPIAGAYIGSGTQIQVFDGATAMQFTTNTNLVQGQFRITGTTVTPSSNDITVSTSRTILTINSVNAGVIIGNHSAMSNTVDVVKITYAIQARRYGDDSGLSTELVNFTLDQTITKSKAGIDSRSLRISSEGLVFTKQKDYTLTPTRLRLTAKKQNITVTPTWTNNGNPAVVFRSSSGASLTSTAVADEVYIYASDLSTNTAIDITLTATQTNSLGVPLPTFTDTEKLIVVMEGTDGISSSMPNASHTLPSNDLGVVEATDYVGSGTIIRLFEGGEELDYVASIGTNDRKKFTIGTTVVTPTGGITVGLPTDNAPTTGGVTIGDHSGMNPAYSVVTIDYPITVRRANGTNTTLKLTQTITKSVAGVDAKSLKLTTSALTFKYDTNNTATPATQIITFKAALENIVDTIPTFTCTLYNADNTTFNNGNNGVVTLGTGANALERTLTNTQFSSANYAKIECSLIYRDILYTDTQTIFRVKDGADGSPGTSPPRSPFRSYGATFGIYLDGTPTSWYGGGTSTNDVNASTVIWRQLGNAGSPPTGSTAHLVANDEVTLVSSGGGGFTATGVWTQQSGVYDWYFPGKTIDGNLLVNGTITADSIQTGTFSSNTAVTRGLEIWNTDGTVKVFSAGGGLNGVYIKTANIEELNVTSGKIALQAANSVRSFDANANQLVTETTYPYTIPVQYYDPYSGWYTVYETDYSQPVTNTYWTLKTFGPNSGYSSWWTTDQYPSSLVFDAVESGVSVQAVVMIIAITASENNTAATNVGITAQWRSWPDGGWSNNFKVISFSNQKGYTEAHVTVATANPNTSGPIQVRAGIGNDGNGYFTAQCAVSAQAVIR